MKKGSVYPKHGVLCDLKKFSTKVICYHHSIFFSLPSLFCTHEVKQTQFFFEAPINKTDNHFKEWLMISFRIFHFHFVSRKHCYFFRNIFSCIKRFLKCQQSLKEFTKSKKISPQMEDLTWKQKWRETSPKETFKLLSVFCEWTSRPVT